jgi:hypothetical protein
MEYWNDEDVQVLLVFHPLFQYSNSSFEVSR